MLKKKLISFALCFGMITSVNIDAIAENGATELKCCKPQPQTQENDAIVTSKTLTPVDGTENFQVNLEAYTTGKVEIESSPAPCDIVLVLDQSGSMAYNFSSEKTIVNDSMPSETADGETGQSWSDFKGNLYFQPNDSESSYEIYIYKDVNTYGYYFYIRNYGYVYIAEGIAPNEEISLQQLILEEFEVSGDVYYTSAVSKGEYLKLTATNFIQNVASQSPESKVAIVGFANGEDNNYSNTEILSLDSPVNYANTLDSDYSGCLVDVKDSNGNINSILTGAINNYEADGATGSDLGLDMAQKIFANQEKTDEQRNRFVVFLSDGVPTRTNRFDKGVGNNALLCANEIKSTYNADVYSIGMFPNADPNFCNYDGSRGWSEGEKANTFMNLVSSNYPSATNFNNHGSRIEADKNYYLTANSADELNTVFTTISTEIANSNSDLNGNAVVRDVVSQYFTLPEGITPQDITVQTVNCTGADSNGNLQFDEATRAPCEGALPLALDDTVTVTGFDFSSEFCTANSRTINDNPYYGKKLCISFIIQPKDEFMGGNNVPTNDYILNDNGAIYDSKQSGIYANCEADSLAQNFTVPYANVPIKSVIAEKAINIYAGDEVTLENMYDPINVDMTWEDDFVSISYALAEGNVVQSFNDGAYTVNATVSPNTNGDGAAGIPATENIYGLTTNVNVFKPQIPFVDSTIYLGERVDYANNAVGTVLWKHGDTLSTDAEMITENEPILSFKYDPALTQDADGYFKKDTGVNVTNVETDRDITLFDNNAVNYVTFTNSVEQIDDGREFTVYVKSCDLTITKSGCNNTYGGDDQTFIFKVKGNEDNNIYAKEIDLTVVVNGNGSKKIVQLPVGNYTVTEMENWSWRYAPTIPPVTLSSNQSSQSVTATAVNTLTEDKWLNGYSFADNVFKKLNNDESD